MLVPAGSPIFFLRQHRFAVRCRVVTLRQLLWTLCSYAVIHVEYVFIAHILIYIGCATLYHLSMMYVTVLYICHLIITRILTAELNYRFTNSKTSLAIVIATVQPTGRGITEF